MNQKIRILVADDHQILRDSVSRFLGAQTDFQVVGLAANGLAAVDLSASLLPDVVVLDFNMPHLNGDEAARRILQAQPEIVVIGFSMEEDGPTSEAMQLAGAVAYVSKDNPRDLIPTIRRCVRQSDPESGAS